MKLMDIKKYFSKQSTMLFLISTFACWLVIFALGKLGFILYNHAENETSIGDTFDVLRHGFSMDMSTAGYLVIIPWLVSFIFVLCNKGSDKARKIWSRTLISYSIAVAIVVALVLCGDTFLYEYWKTKLNASIFVYMQNVEGAANSVSMWFVISRILAILISAVACATLLILPVKYFAKKIQHEQVKKPLFIGIMVLLGGFDFLAIRGGLSPAVQNVGTAYYSQNLFLNHAGVNPVFSVFSSIKRAENYGKEFQFFSKEHIEKNFKSEYIPVYPGTCKDYYIADSQLTDTLLTTNRPNVLIVLMESFGSKFVEELGGIPNVAPNLSRFIKEGVFFDNYYSNSFRTDRGTVSLFSGWLGYPTVSLMRVPNKMEHLPGLGKSLMREDYKTYYLYAGDITVMGKSSYLISSGFETLFSDKDFSSADANSSKWGVPDDKSATKTAELVDKLYKEQNGKPFLFGYQTISSHEPFEVPYSRLDDKVANAFAYTDESVGKMVDELRKSPAWDNLLIVLVPDHGMLYELSYENPEFFHSPMIWVGGAVKEHKVVHNLMNQSDFCATLLGQMGIDASDYPYSRNVFSKGSKYMEKPFIYSTFSSGAVYIDSTGTIVYDTDANRVIKDVDTSPSNGISREEKIKLLLQNSYTQLSEL